MSPEIIDPNLPLDAEQREALQRRVIKKHDTAVILLHWFNAAIWLLELSTGGALLAGPGYKIAPDWWRTFMVSLFGSPAMVLKVHILPADPMTFGAGTPTERVVHRISKVSDGEHLTLDLLLVSPALEKAWEDREIYEWKGRPVRVVSVTGLAHMKRLAGRDQDLLDLKKLGIPNEGKS